jgi:DNA-binding IclR family transcriptional regulator
MKLDRRDATPGDGVIRSVDKAFDILDVLSRCGHGLALAEIARRLHFNESTTHHLLATLRQRGVVAQDAVTKEYRLGYGLIGMVNGFLARTDLYSAGVGPIRELRDVSGETAYLSVIQNQTFVSVIELVGWKPVQARRGHEHGETTLHSTASGKVYLAYLPADRARAILSSVQLTKYTPSTLTTLDELDRELAAIRQQGYALDREENIPGIMCVAAPILGTHGEYVASASVAAPVAGPERVAELIPIVVNAADQVSRNLGHVRVLRRDGGEPGGGQ